jgi:uncharacterized membrane protein
MALVTLFVFVVWMYQVWLLISLLLGPNVSFASVSEFLRVVLTTNAGLSWRSRIGSSQDRIANIYR